MLRKRKLSVMWLAVLAAASGEAQAGLMTAADIDPSTASFSVVSNGTFGWAFTLSADILVTDLGFFDRNGDGLAIPHSVGIWDASQSLVASATVPSGTTAPLNDDFRYIGITPVNLFSGESYVIGANNPQNTGHNETFALNIGTISFDPYVAFNGGRWVQSTTDPSFGDSLQYPVNSAASNSYFGPNFQFRPAPEPSSFALFTAGACVAGIAAALRRRRGTAPEAKEVTA